MGWGNPELLPSRIDFPAANWVPNKSPSKDSAYSFNSFSEIAALHLLGTQFSRSHCLPSEEDSHPSSLCSWILELHAVRVVLRRVCRQVSSTEPILM